MGKPQRRQARLFLYTSVVCLSMLTLCTVIFPSKIMIKRMWMSIFDWYDGGEDAIPIYKARVVRLQAAEGLV